MSIALSPSSSAVEPVVPRIFQSDGRDLAAVKRRLSSGDATLTAAVAELRKRADEELKTEPLTIVN